MNVVGPAKLDGAEPTLGVLTLSEMASFLKISKKTLYYWVARREIPYIKMGRHIRFDCREVMRFFRNRSVERGHGCPWNSDLVRPNHRSLTTSLGSLAEGKDFSNGN